MMYTPALIPALITAANDTIAANAKEVEELDQTLGDGDHVVNLQRGLAALLAQRETLATLTWPQAWQRMGMTLMSNIGGAYGPLLGTLLLELGKTQPEPPLNQASFAASFASAVDAVKRRGKSEAGEKTLLDVLCPTAATLQAAAADGMPLPELLTKISAAAVAGMMATGPMQASKGRAAFLAERSLGHIDAGARSMQLMVCAVASVLLKHHHGLI